jgi:hypothetical protein
MPNIDNDKSTRVLSQKLRKVNIYISSIKSLCNRGWKGQTFIAAPINLKDKAAGMDDFKSV